MIFLFSFVPLVDFLEPVENVELYDIGNYDQYIDDISEILKYRETYRELRGRYNTALYNHFNNHLIVNDEYLAIQNIIFCNALILIFTKENFFYLICKYNNDPKFEIVFQSKALLKECLTDLCK